MIYTNKHEIPICTTDLRVGALDMDRLQVNMEADYKGGPFLRAALQFRRDGQSGSTSHGLQQAEALLLSQQGVYAELTQADGPWEGVTCQTPKQGKGLNIKINQKSSLFFII